MRWYLDASILVPLNIVELSSPVVYNRLSASDAEFFVSSLAISEYASAISRRVRMGDADPDETEVWFGQLETWIESDAHHLPVEDQDIREGGLIVRKFETKLKTADAIHVGLCRRHGLVLVTLDKWLAEAAGMLGVETVVPE